MISDLIVIEEEHLPDPDGDVVRRLATITNPLEIPSPLPSEIVRNWPDAMWTRRDDKILQCDGRVGFCATGILAEVSGYAWGESDLTLDDGEKRWGGEYDSASAYFVQHQYGLTYQQTRTLMERNDKRGKDAAADLLESWGM